MCARGIRSDRVRRGSLREHEGTGYQASLPAGPHVPQPDGGLETRPRRAPHVIIYIYIYIYIYIIYIYIYI